MRYLTLGSYQIKHSLRYTKKHVSETGDYDVQICNDPGKPYFRRTKIQSTHSNQIQYNVCLDYEPNSEGYEVINRYCCRCGLGSRKVKTCSHTTTFVIYLGTVDIQYSYPNKKVTRVFQIVSDKSFIQFFH